MICTAVADGSRQNRLDRPVNVPINKKSLRAKPRLRDRKIVLWIVIAVLFALGLILGWTLRADRVERQHIEVHAQNTLSTVHRAFESFVAPRDMPPEFPPERFARFAELVKSRLNIEVATPTFRDGPIRFVGNRIVPIGPQQAAMWIVSTDNGRASVILLPQTKGLGETVRKAADSGPPTHAAQHGDFDVLTIGDLAEDHRSTLFAQFIGNSTAGDN